MYNMSNDWIQSIMDIYWKMRPCKETQELYNSNGFKPFHYWKLEIEFLTKSIWIKNAEFRALVGIEYLLNKYPGETVRLDEIDQLKLRNRFLYDLGIPPEFYCGDHTEIDINNLIDPSEHYV